MSTPHVVILGGGPAGLGAAYRLRTLDRARVTVLERGDRVGGNAGSFEIGAQRVDFGSHRLHPSCAPEILADIRRHLGADLRERKRHGRIRLGSRWLHFPLKPFDLLRHLDPAFAARALRDAAVRIVARPSGEADSFASALRARLGPTICDNFYFPYARKIWGLPPEEIAAEQAHRRVAANSPGKLVRKVLAQVPGFRAPGAGRFFYPVGGFGKISEGYAREAEASGAELRLGYSATRLAASTAPDAPWAVEANGPDGPVRIEADYVWSTIPVTLLARMTQPAPPQDVVRAATALGYRAMVLVYLTIPVDRFTEYDAHYFPGADVRVTRLSEPKNYAGVPKPVGTTVLCAELPCSPEDPVWTQSDEELARLVAGDLDSAGVPLPRPPSEIVVRRLRHAYPIYTRDFAAPFEALDHWAAGLPRLLTFGRQGLFAHDNTHHALAMAYAAVDCLDQGEFDDAKWARYREDFQKHVVVD